MDKIPSGMTISVKAVQAENALCSILSILSGSVICVRDRHLEKALSLMIFRLSGATNTVAGFPSG